MSSRRKAGWKGVRQLGERRYKRLFLVATEGAITEPQYFHAFNSDQTIVRVDCLRSGSDSAPAHVLKRLVQAVRDERLRKEDQAWLVIDRDDWPEQQLSACVAWVGERKGRGLALSNPNFEYWLLLHFEEAQGVSSPEHIRHRLRQYLAGYDKHLTRPFTAEQIRMACARAQRHDRPETLTWPQNVGSTAYRLVRAISAAQDA